MPPLKSRPGVILLFGFFSAVLVFFADAPARAAPSFACGSRDPIETAIRKDPALAARDRTMARLFSAVRVSALGKGRSNELAEQRSWLARRNQCAGRFLTQCLASAYDERLWDLAIAALFASHDAAIAELRRQKPKYAQIYEAVYRYATIADQRRRASVVGRLIAPAFDTLHIIPDPQQLFEGMPTPMAAAASDEHFSRFLAAVSDNYAEALAPLVLPCAALVRRPGLTAALEARYGGAGDNFLPRTDCETTLPPLPGFDKLVKTAVDLQPACQGSIRFAFRADFERMLTEVRLHDFRPKRRRPPDEPPPADFIRSNSSQIEAATKELAAYYALYFPSARSSAETDAADAMHAVLGGAFNLCETG